MKKSLKRFITRWYVILSLLIIIIALAYILTHRTKTATFESSIAVVGTIVERVSVTGKVSPIQKTDLAFEKSGVISKLNVKVGDIIGKGAEVASLENAADRAAVQSAEATLDDLSRKLRPEELAVEQAALDSAKKSALTAVHDALIKSQDAVFNYADTFFLNPQTVNPAINIKTRSTVEQTSVNAMRLSITNTINEWSNDLNQSNSDNISQVISDSINYLAKIKSYMTVLLGIVNDLNTGTSGLSTTAISSAIATMNSGLSTLNAAIDSVVSANSALLSADSNYRLKLSRNSSQTIAAQAAKVAQARAILSQDIVTSPIDGIVTAVGPAVGEFVGAGQTAISIQSDGLYKIEAYVPEADIAKIAIGNTASSTLDAYGQYVDFPAVVSNIDPAETVLEGVPTYKVTLYFVDKDSRIRSGMTANLEILTREHIAVVTVPARSIIDNNGQKSVRLLNSDGKSFTIVPVIVGLKGSDGMIEIIAGIREGDRIVTYVK